jgi:hypothetical protein
VFPPLHLSSDILVSNSAFNRDLRRYDVLERIAKRCMLRSYPAVGLCASNQVDP